MALPLPFQNIASLALHAWPYHFQYMTDAYPLESTFSHLPDPSEIRYSQVEECLFHSISAAYEPLAVYIATTKKISQLLSQIGVNEEVLLEYSPLWKDLLEQHKYVELNTILLTSLNTTISQDLLSDRQANFQQTAAINSLAQFFFKEELRDLQIWFAQACLEEVILTRPDTNTVTLDRIHHIESLGNHYSSLVQEPLKLDFSNVKSLISETPAPSARCKRSYNSDNSNAHQDIRRRLENPTSMQ